MKKEKSKSTKIEDRLQNMKKFFLKAEEMIDKIPEVIPEDKKKLIKEKIFGDKELRKLIDGIDSHRPPRIFLIGRTGVGKSSLINALYGSYKAKVSDTRSCTDKAESFLIKDGERVLMEIFDTRGIAESESLDEKTSAEDMLIDQINEFSPDVAIFMLNCTHRDDIVTDVEFLKKLSKDYEKRNSLRLPIVTVINKCDEMAPSRIKNPLEYPQSKIDKIEDVCKYYKGIIVKNGLKIDDIIAVSSLIDWETPDGTEVAVEVIDDLPENDIENLKIAFDGRYQIEKLHDILEEAILDFEAQMGLRMAFRLNDVVERISNHLIKVFSTIAAGVALSPIPIADIYILTTMQAILVCMIASLSGRDISLDTAKEFIFSIGGVAGAGFGFRLAAQQASKILNVFYPGAGSAVSSAIAAAGTAAIGKAAITYYIDEKPIELAKEKVLENLK